MAKFARAAQLFRLFKQTSTPTVSQGLTVGDIWVDTDASPITQYVCSAISPVTFITVGLSTVADTDVTFTDVTTNNASTTKHGYAPKGENTGTKFYRDDNTWATPAGSSSPLTTKGDLYTYTSVDARLAVGTDGQHPVADSSASAGLSYDWPAPILKRSINMSLDFLNGLSNEGVLTSSVSGTAAANAAATTVTDGTAEGELEMYMGTTTTGRCSVRLNGSGSLFPGGGQLVFECRVKIPTLSDGTDTFAINVGMISGFSNIATADSTYFSYTHSASSGHWEGKTDNGGSITTVDTGITVAINTYYNLKLVVNATNTLVTFYVNGTSVGTSNSNLSTAGNFPVLMIKKSAGTGDRFMYADYLSVRKDFTTAR